MEYSNELAVALAAVREASVLCQAVQRRIDRGTISKDDKSPVTIADFASQAVILRAIGDVFPNDAIIAEEASAALRTPEAASQLQQVVDLIKGVVSTATAEEVCRWIDLGTGHGGTDRFWTLDPIDGTKGFLRGEQYAISLALYEHGQLQVGILGCPNLSPVDPDKTVPGGIFYAVRGHGAFAASLDGSLLPRPITVSTIENASAIRLCQSVESGHTRQDQAAIVAERLHAHGKPIKMDSQAKYACVAAGWAEAYLRLPTRADYQECIWDHAGGVLVVEEAGGKVTDIDGKPLDFSRGKKLVANRGVIGTNGVLHDRVLEAVQATLAPR